MSVNRTLQDAAGENRVSYTIQKKAENRPEEVLLSVLRRLEELEQAYGAGIDTDEEAPQIVICWPEHETPEIRAQNREAREWYRQRGINPFALPVKLCWRDGTEVSPP